MAMSTIDSIVGLYCRNNNISWDEQQLLKRVYKKCNSPWEEFPRPRAKRAMDYFVLTLTGSGGEKRLYEKLENSSEYREWVHHVVEDLHKYIKRPGDLLYEQY